MTIFDRDLTPQTEFLQKFLSATICCLDDVERQNENEGILWRGKVSICDKIVSINFVSRNESSPEKTNNFGFRPGPKQTSSDSHRSRLEA